MPKVYDNIGDHVTHGLNESIQHSRRADFCVGYFYLSGWKEIADKEIRQTRWPFNRRCSWSGKNYNDLRIRKGV
jgi:hypothetical protein